MSKDQKRLYIISFAIFAVLLGALLIQVGNDRIITACLLAVMTPVACLLIKKRSSLSINKKEVLLLSVILAVLYVIIVQMSGIYFGYYKNPYFVTTESILKTILPLIVIIITSEIIRFVLLVQKNKVVSAIAFLSCLLSEILAFANLSDINSLNNFMDLVGLIVFPAISANIYYHYTAKRFGALPNIAFRLITAFYTYFLPSITGMSDSLFACFKLILPIIVLSVVMALFEKKKKNAVRKGEKLGVFATVLTVVFVVSVAMLISCQFRFGALVIATESMTGEINKGDMILYERYDGQQIKEGQIIVFLDGESRIVHRVVRIENIEGEFRYYTKGDANQEPDSGYRLETDIIGLTETKLAYLGYPTLWLKEIIKK